MKTEKLVWGLILIFIGGIFLLENFDIIDFYWGSVWRFWPLILIVIGVNMLFSRTEYAAGPYLGVTLTVLVLGFIGYQGIAGPYRGIFGIRYEHSDNYTFNDDDSDDGSDSRTRRLLSEPMSSSVKYATLNIRGGATSYIINDSTSNLVEARILANKNNYTLISRDHDSSRVIDLVLANGKRTFHLNELEDLSAKIRLNPAIIWDIDVNIGAGESNFDLRGFKVNSLDFKGGAASFKAKLGEPLNTTHVSANTGVSEVELSIPKSSGCQIKVKSGLSSRDFDGFTKLKDGLYETANFNSSAKKIIIDLKGGLSDFEVKRY